MITKIRQAVSKLGMPRGDLYELPTSTKTFPDGANYRIEISGIETVKVLDATIDEAQKQGVPFHRAISVVRGATLLTREELKEFAKIAHDAKVEVIMTPGPRPTWDIGRQAATPILLLTSTFNTLLPSAGIIASMRRRKSPGWLLPVISKWNRGQPSACTCPLGLPKKHGSARQGENSFREKYYGTDS